MEQVKWNANKHSSASVHIKFNKCSKILFKKNHRIELKRMLNIWTKEKCKKKINVSARMSSKTSQKIGSLCVIKGFPIIFVCAVLKSISCLNLNLFKWIIENGIFFVFNRFHFGRYSIEFRSYVDVCMCMRMTERLSEQKIYICSVIKPWI